MRTGTKPRKIVRPRRRGTKAATREQLIQAAMQLLHEGGEAAVTTVSVTRAAGIVQSLFYQHFSHVEDCLAAATERIAAELREAVVANRRKLYETPAIGEDLVQSYREMFALLSQHRPIVQLFLRYRSDPLALNGVMYRFNQALSSDLAEQLLAKHGEAGLNALPPGWLEGLADDLVAVSLAATEALFDGRGPTVEDSARRLAVCATAMVQAVIQANPTTDARVAASRKHERPISGTIC